MHHLANEQSSKRRLRMWLYKDIHYPHASSEEVDSEVMHLGKSTRHVSAFDRTRLANWIVKIIAWKPSGCR